MVNNDNANLSCHKIEGNAKSMCAISKSFAKAALDQLNLSIAEWITFIYALSHIRWTDKTPNKPVAVTLSKRELAGKIGINPDSDHLSQDLLKKIKYLPDHSNINIEEKYSGHFIKGIEKRTGSITIIFSETFLRHFFDLNKKYLTLYSNDIYQMKHSRSIKLYIYLRYHSDTRKNNVHDIAVGTLKHLFNIPWDGKGSYMKKNGSFNRSQFEKNVIDPVTKDFENSKMITLKKFYEKDKQKYYKKIRKPHALVQYRFGYTITNRPNIVAASERETLVEKIEKNPLILKFAEDMVKSNETRKKNKESKTPFCPERKYTNEDFKEMEEILFSN